MTGVKSHLVLLALVVCVSCWAPNAMADCTGSSPTWTATNDYASVNTCVTNAKAGDTINVGAGTATWASTINITKNLNIIGAGQGVTIINGTPFTITGTKATGNTVSFRLSGMTINLNLGRIDIVNATNFRIDHVTFVQPYAYGCTMTYSTDGTIITGLYDHITATYCQFEEWNDGSPYTSNGANISYAAPTPLISSNQAVYFEDSSFTNPDPSSANGGYFNCWDEILGGRYVIRFNTMGGCRIEGHGIQADNERAARWWEVYQNSMVNSHAAGNCPARTGTYCGYWPFSQRGGTGMIHHNTLDANWLQPYARLDSPRSNEDSIGVSGQVPLWQFCDGTSQSTYLTTPGNLSGGYTTFPSPKALIVDGRSAGGYRCRDQIGAGSDSSTWAAGWNTIPPAQALAPAYIWKNLLGGSEMPVTVTCETGDNLCTNQNTNIIVQNRDYYTYNASFNGTSGVAEGSLASRPSTCTTGVAYWATDQGSWNTKLAVNTSGQLYVCTSTNTWSLYYIPYTYPHPLQGSSGATQPVAPTSLKASVQ